MHLPYRRHKLNASTTAAEQPQQQQQQSRTPQPSITMFSWSTPAGRGTPNAGYPGARNASPVRATAINGTIRAPEFTRAQHIESYLNDGTLKRSTRQVSQDDSTYDTVFQTTRGDTLIVRVHLPPPSGGQSRAPAMTLAGVRGRHSWLDSKMRITGYAPIQSDDAWRSSRILLGAAVHEVVKHMQLEPPEIVEITDAGLRSIQANRKNNGSSTRSSTASSAAVGRSAHSSASQQQSASSDAPPEYSSVLLDMPEIPRQIPELDALTREELDQLLEDELEFTSFINGLPIFDKIQSTANDVLDENSKKATANLEKEEKVKTLHKEVTELKTKLEGKLEHFATLEQKQDALCAPPDKKDILRQLAKAKKESFHVSEQLAEGWVEDGANVDGFVREFVEKRNIHHIRAAKMERLQFASAKNV
ncbi:Modifier of rudimentary (Mod(r)) protein [Seminavis robusta]|uniref:Modifier of rudimentary (Mod(R)) protein n=1 Tax=Seminavis robusta TaxID=568900 RepID=A0A9N8H415_9STRA|nr:Modifier of rudimentary (Mod(r)) protein [Seminavis robusta]|eukprot:Sro50_g029200.1 Modifier of rudimentary (Mod(r)) protein (419) ;mRNA; r:116006-117367